MKQFELYRVYIGIPLTLANLQNGIRTWISNYK